MQRSEDIINESTKQKLTLGIDKNVIKRAKAAGINISELTENVLTAMTFEPNDGNTREDVARAYQALFDIAQSRMCEYSDIQYQIDVGEGGSMKVQLDSHEGLLIRDEQHENLNNAKTSAYGILEVLYKPSEILQNLMKALTIGAEENKERIIELKFALRLVKALSDEEEKYKK